jgi:hypothetical protein
MTEQEKNQLFERLNDMFDEVFDRASPPGGEQMPKQLLTQLKNRASYSASAGDTHIRLVLWWIKGWLFHFSGRGEEELYPFINEYLVVTSKSPAE